MKHFGSIRLFSLALLLLLGATHTAEFLHVVSEDHTYCLEHGAFLDSNHREENDGLWEASEVLADQCNHCSATTASQSQTAPESYFSTTTYPYSDTMQFRSADQAFGQDHVYAYAPKTSPPIYT